MIARLWKTAGWLGVIAALVLSLIPSVIDERGHTDKYVHLAGYAVMMFWWAQIVVRERWKLAVAVLALGVLIELLQGLTPNRDPDVFDALADGAGVLVGWLVARILPNLPRSLAILPAGRR